NTIPAVAAKQSSRYANFFGLRSDQSNFAIVIWDQQHFCARLCDGGQLCTEVYVVVAEPFIGYHFHAQSSGFFFESGGNTVGVVVGSVMDDSYFGCTQGFRSKVCHGFALGWVQEANTEYVWNIGGDVGRSTGWGNHWHIFA